MIPIQCAACGGLAQIDEAWLGREVECPHCHQPTPAAAANSLLPATPPPPPPAPAPLPPPPPPSEPRGSFPRLEPPETIAVTTTPKEPIPTAAPKSKVPAAKPEPKPRRPPLTRDQRDALRRRRHLHFAIGGGLVLIITAAILIALNSAPID